MKRLPEHLAVVVSTMLLASCQTYQPKPLTRAAVDAAMAVPTLDELVVEAGKLQHPILSPVVLDWSAGLSPEQAAVVAVLVHPSLRAERDRRDLARAQLLQAGLLPNPQLSYSMDKPIGANSQGEATALGWGVDWDVTSLITHDAQVRAAQADVLQVDLEVAWQEWAVAEDAKMAACAVISLEMEAALWQQEDERLEQNLAVVRKAVDEHGQTLTDLAAAEASSRDAHDSRLSIEADLRQQRLILKRALGLPADATVHVQDALRLPQHPPSPDTLSEALSFRLDLIALQHGYESQEQHVREAVLGQFPQISLGLAGSRDSGKFYTVGFGASIDLPVFDRNQGQIAIERATRQALFDEYVNRVFLARADMAQALDSIDALQHQITAAQQAIPKLDQLVDAYRRALDQGHVDVLSYYQAQSDAAHKRIDVLEMQRSLAEQWIQLELASGLDLWHSDKTAYAEVTNKEHQP